MGKKINKFKRSKYNPIRIVGMEVKRTLHESKTGRYKTNISKKDALLIAITAIVCSFLVIFSRIMIFARWSTFPSNATFVSWHPWAPWIGLFISLTFIAACWAKGVDYWLVYVAPVVAIIYNIIMLAMINSWLPPQALEPFFGWLAQFEWITGPPVS